VVPQVPDQISRIFFGKGVSGSRPSYSSAYQPPADGYGVPQGYAAAGAGYPQAGYSYYYGENTEKMSLITIQNVEFSFELAPKG